MKKISDLLIDYLNHCEFRKKLDKKTIKAYRIDLNQFVLFIKDYENQFDKYTINTYITNIHKQYKPKTIKRKIASLKAFFNYLEYEEIIDFNPFIKIDIKFREPQKLPKTVPFNIIQLFLITLYKQRELTTSKYQKKVILRDIAVIELLFATGVRISELCSLKITDIDFDNRSILIFGKGAKERIIQIENEEVLKIVKEYYEIYKKEINQTNYFFINRLNSRLSEQSVRFLINKYVNIASINLHITPHMFRHSFATLLLEADVDIRYIQKMLGHSSITTTEIYTNVSSTKQRDILNTKHPRNLINIGEL